MITRVRRRSAQFAEFNWGMPGESTIFCSAANRVRSVRIGARCAKIDRTAKIIRIGRRSDREFLLIERDAQHMPRGFARCHNTKTINSGIIPCFGYVLSIHYAAARHRPGTRVEPEMRTGIQTKARQVVGIPAVFMLSGYLLETSVKDPDCLRTSDPARPDDSVVEAGRPLAISLQIPLV